MKLLLDENLSDRIVPAINNLYPSSAHIKAFELLHADDVIIWNFAAQNGFSVVSKDSDFHQRSLVFGAPPKFIYLRVGNCSTKQIVHLLRGNYLAIAMFLADRFSSIYVLT